MKILNFLFVMFFITSMSYAQNAPINFEAGGFGASWTWSVFENGAVPPAVEIIANPVSGGINTSATVAKFTALQAGAPWAGCQSAHGTTDLGEFVLDASNSVIKIMVYKTVISDVGIKLVSSTDWAQVEIKHANTVTNQWEELTFDFSTYINPPAGNGVLDRIVVFPDFNARTQDNIIYFDNITFNAGGVTPTIPTVAAPIPTENSANVISLFSGAYTNVTVDTWRTDWSVATYEEVEIAGNPTKKYSALDFVGIETVANQIDITSMTYFHLDVWSPNFTKFGVKLVDFGADGLYGGGDDVNHQVDFESPEQEEWVSFDIPLTAFTGLTTKQHIAQLILVGQPTGTTTIYLDNVYFYEGTVTPEGPTVAAPTPTQSASNVISMFSNAFTDVTVDTWRTDWSAAIYEEVEIEGNDTKKYSNLDFVGIETIANQIDITGMTNFHLDVWSPNFTKFGVKLVDFGADGAYDGGDDVNHQIDFETPAQEEWVSFDILLTDFTGLTTKQHIAQLILVGQPTGTSTIYLDNVYFYNGNTNVKESISNQIFAFPNPALRGTQINLSEEVKQVQILDISGKIMMTSNSSSVINTQNLTQGIYILKINTKDNIIKTQKLVIN